LSPAGLLTFEPMNTPPLECQHHANCGGCCETEEEVDFCLCCHCLEAYHEREAEDEWRQRARDLLPQLAAELRSWEATAWDGCPKRRASDVACRKALELATKAERLLEKASAIRRSLPAD
jgi:hypothetical protein